MYYDSNVRDCSGDTEAAENLYATCQGVADGSADPGRFSFLIAHTGISDSILTVDIAENGSYSIV